QKIGFLSSLFIVLLTSNAFTQQAPNILLIIADDLGVDYTNGYHQGGRMPVTPTLDSLRSAGITFENVFAAPKCTPSRAAILSGKYGVNTGVIGTPGNLDLTHTSLLTELAALTNNQYADAVIGKWHLSSPADPQHPHDHGADYFMGVMGASVSDYYSWTKTENGTTSNETQYATSAFTDASINWVAAQEKPWLLWLAHTAPHAPFHVPPADLYTSNTNGRVGQYITMVEAMDHEINRLIQSLSEEDKNNTLILFVGDNGTPGTILKDYPDGRGKSTLYQGGVRVPLIVSGAGVTRKGEREPALIHITDIYATILEAAGAQLAGGRGVYNSLSFYPLLSGSDFSGRLYNYTEIGREDPSGWTIRDEQYKLIEFEDGTQEFYDLQIDSFELDNLLLGTLDQIQMTTKTALEQEAFAIRNGWSCQDLIQNGDEVGVDCGGSSCNSCLTTSTQDLLLARELKVFPNPVKNTLNIYSEKEPIQGLSIYNASGQLLWRQQNLETQTISTNLAHLEAQLMLLELK
ncbi:MAG: sulfatase-like hydrolase/transferase, partial [Bacteroidota bacterium]